MTHQAIPIDAEELRLLREDAACHRFARTVFSIDDVTLAVDSMRDFKSTEEENAKYDAAIDVARAEAIK